MIRNANTGTHEDCPKHGVELVKGNGYHYFADTDGSYKNQSIPSVMDGGFLRCMTVEQWVNHVESSLAESQR
jgi:hypothetical protein